MREEGTRKGGGKRKIPFRKGERERKGAREPLNGEWSRRTPLGEEEPWREGTDAGREGIRPAFWQPDDDNPATHV